MQGPKWPLFTLIWTLCGCWMCWDRLCTKGRAPRTEETLPDFRERCRVTRHSRAFLRVVNGPLGFGASQDCHMGVTLVRGQRGDGVYYYPASIPL